MDAARLVGFGVEAGFAGRHTGKVDHGFRGWVLRYSDVSGRLVEFSDECLYERTSQ